MRFPQVVRYTLRTTLEKISTPCCLLPAGLDRPALPHHPGNSPFESRAQRWGPLPALLPKLWNGVTRTTRLSLISSGEIHTRCLSNLWTYSSNIDYRLSSQKDIRCAETGQSKVLCIRRYNIIKAEFRRWGPRKMSHMD